MNDQPIENSAAQPPDTAPAIPEVDESLQRRFRLGRGVVPLAPTPDSSDTPTT
ncbi:hypothetical protein [Burkholderia pseudomallei]|uniref:hypothetical protein n=1 Tax=Burkholderia pseudomallei TaxID=28450 RepID=UPI0012AEB544|nr:hypothetical protein [Burkholderia pseudomallei]